MKRLPKKKIIAILTRVYFMGVRDGMDKLRQPDRFFGDSSMWLEWEEEIIENKYQDIKKLI